MSNFFLYVKTKYRKSSFYSILRLLERKKVGKSLIIDG